jgi:hypothetical protein
VAGSSRLVNEVWSTTGYTRVGQVTALGWLRKRRRSLAGRPGGGDQSIAAPFTACGKRPWRLFARGPPKPQARAARPRIPAPPQLQCMATIELRYEAAATLILRGHLSRTNPAHRALLRSSRDPSACRRSRGERGHGRGEEGAAMTPCALGGR